MERLTIIDYGAGNLLSAYKAIQCASQNQSKEIQTICSGHYKDIINADRIVLPGVGSFADCMNNLQKNTSLYDALLEKVTQQKKPFLGICVGMQLMASVGFEFTEKTGLNWIEGHIVRLAPQKSSLKIPHMGWNKLDITDIHHPITHNLSKNRYAYFVHSYHFKAKQSHTILATCNYAENITAIIAKDNMIGFQFHPEKSQSFGQELLTNFLQWSL